jgi:hypothetical protein
VYSHGCLIGLLMYYHQNFPSKAIKFLNPQTANDAIVPFESLPTTGLSRIKLWRRFASLRRFMTVGIVDTIPSRTPLP